MAETPVTNGQLLTSGDQALIISGVDSSNFARFIKTDTTGAVQVGGSISCDVTATIVGTPSFSIAGIPAVTIDGTPTVIADIGTTNGLALNSTLTNGSQIVQISNGSNAVAISTSLTGSEYGLVTRNIPYGTQTVSVSGTPSVTISGTPSVSISGTPSVSVSNTVGVSFPSTPTVNIGTMPSISGSVSVTNTVGVSFASTPTVNIGTMPSITGSVSITGTPSVSITGTPSVSITGTPSVSVSNTVGVSFPSTPTVDIGTMPSITGSVSITGTPSVSISGTPAVTVSSGTITANIGTNPTVATNNATAPSSSTLMGALNGATIAPLVSSSGLPTTGTQSVVFCMSPYTVSSGAVYAQTAAFTTSTYSNTVNLAGNSANPPYIPISVFCQQTFVSGSPSYSATFCRAVSSKLGGTLTFTTVDCTLVQSITMIAGFVYNILINTIYINGNGYSSGTNTSDLVIFI